MATQPTPDSRASRTGNLDAAVFGLIVADIIAAPFALRTPPTPGGLSLVDSITLTTGGNVCNTGIALAKPGIRVAPSGKVGGDLPWLARAEELRPAAGCRSCAVQAATVR